MGRVLIAVVVMVLAGIYGIAPIARATLVAHPPRAALPAGLAPSFDYEVVTFDTLEHLTLHGWYAPSCNGATVILLHGYKDQRANYLEEACYLVEHGYGVLLMDQAAHGESAGNTLTLDGSDVLAAVDYVRARPDVDSDRIALWGFSLGGQVAIQAAAQDTSVRAVIADGPFPVVAEQDMPSPETLEDCLWKPFDWVQWQALAVYGVVPAMPTTEALAHIAPRPLLLIAGIENRGERRVLRHYANKAGESSELWEVDAGHVGAWGAHRSEYESKALAFLEQGLFD